MEEPLFACTHNKIKHTKTHALILTTQAGDLELCYLSDFTDIKTFYELAPRESHRLPETMPVVGFCEVGGRGDIIPSWKSLTYRNM